MSAEPEGFMTKRPIPGGYVVGKKKVGLLNTVFCPDESLGFFYVGRDNQEVGVLTIRHDAQFAQPRKAATARGPSGTQSVINEDGSGGIAPIGTVGRIATGPAPILGRIDEGVPQTQEKLPGDNWVGRMDIRDEDVAGVKRGKGRKAVGYFAWDSSKANTNTFFGHETGQIVVVVDLPEEERTPPPITDGPSGPNVPRTGQGEDGNDGAPGAPGADGNDGAPGAPGNCDDCVCDCPTADYGYGTSGAHFQVSDDSTFQVLYAESLDGNGFTLLVPDFQVFVSQTLTFNGARFGNNAEAGGNGATGGPGGAGGSGTSTGTLPPGGAGGLGGTSTQPNGVAGTNVANTFGGAGGAGGAWAGAGGAGGTATPPAVGYGNPNGYQAATTGIMTSYLGTVALGGGGGGGGGSGGNVGTGECGGGGGAGGRRLIVVARNIVKGTGTPSIEARGGNGGNSSSLTEGSGGGGGGGGHIAIVCDSVDFDIEAICDVSGGTGGTGATAGQDGDDGWVQLLVRPVPA